MVSGFCLGDLLAKQRVCWVCAARGPGEPVVLPSQPSGFARSPVPCNCFCWSPWTGQGKTCCLALHHAVLGGVSSASAKHRDKAKGNARRRRGCKEPEKGKEEGQIGAIRSCALNGELRGVWVCLVLDIKSCLLHGNL